MGTTGVLMDLVAIQLQEKRMFYFVSLFEGVGAPTALLRFMNFLDCMFTSQNKFLDWKDWQYYTILATEIVKGTNPLCSNLKENFNNKRHGDMKLDSDFELPKKRQKKSTGKQIPSMLYPVSKGSPLPYKVRKVKTTHMLRMEIMLTKFPLQHQFLRQQKTFYHLVMCACARNFMSYQQKGLQGHLRVPFISNYQ